MVPAGPSKGQRLVRRLAVVNMVALFPLALLAIAQTLTLLQDSAATRSRAAMAGTVQAAQGELTIINTAQTLARTLAVLTAPVVDDTAACTTLMEGAGAAYPKFSLIGFVRMNGVMDCATGRQRFDFMTSTLYTRMFETAEPRLSLSRIGPVSGGPVLTATHPVFSGGTQVGVITISIPQQAVSTTNRNPVGERDLGDELVTLPSALITFDGSGNVLTSTTDPTVAAYHLPVSHDLAGLASQGPQTFADRNRAGTPQIFAVVPITSELSLIGAWEPASNNALVDPRVAPWLVAILMVIAGLVAADIAAERLVVRHVRNLSGAMGAMRGGMRKPVQARLVDPPAEIAALSQVYADMLETIERDEAELENLLHQKEDLLRELHHRTGNSLQLIASILRMHMRENPEDAVRQVLEHLLERVMSLSTVHLGLYRIAGHADIAVDQLIADVLAKLDTLHARALRANAITADLKPLRLASPQAVPLALLVTEVLAGFLTDPGGAEMNVHVALYGTSGGMAVLSVSGPASARTYITGSGGKAPEVIASRLIRGFVAQLEGEMRLLNGEGSLTVEVQFLARGRNPDPLPETPAEARPRDASAA